jgi:hypothetical protein
MFLKNLQVNMVLEDQHIFTTLRTSDLNMHSDLLSFGCTSSNQIAKFLMPGHQSVHLEDGRSQVLQNSLPHLSVITRNENNNRDLRFS